MAAYCQNWAIQRRADNLNGGCLSLCHADILIVSNPSVGDKWHLMDYCQCVCPWLVFGLEREVKGFSGRTDMACPPQKGYSVQEWWPVHKFVNTLQGMNRACFEGSKKLKHNRTFLIYRN